MTELNGRLVSQSRRSFVKAAVYAAPLIVTLEAEPAFASYGSSKTFDAVPGQRRAILRQGRSKPDLSGLGASRRRK